MNLVHLAVSTAVWSLCAYAKAPETPKQMIRNISEPAPTCMIREEIGDRLGFFLSASFCSLEPVKVLNANSIILIESVFLTKSNAYFQLSITLILLKRIIVMYQRVINLREQELSPDKSKSSCYQLESKQ